MKLKEIPLLYAKRPFAISPAADVKVNHHGSLLDEELALKLDFPIKQLQYTRLSLHEKTVRVCGTVRVTVQTIVNGRSAQSVPFVAKVVRDLFIVTGAEAVGSEDLFQKVSPISKIINNSNKSGQENESYCSDSNVSNEVREYGTENGSEYSSSEESNLSSLDTPIFASLDQVFTIMDENNRRRMRRKRSYYDKDFNSEETIHNGDYSSIDHDAEENLQNKASCLQSLQPEAMTPFEYRQLCHLNHLHQLNSIQHLRPCENASSFQPSTYSELREWPGQTVQEFHFANLPS